MPHSRSQTAARPAAHGLLIGAKTARSVLQAVHGGSDLRSAAANVLGFQQESMKGKPVSVNPVPKVATPALRRLLDLCTSHSGRPQQVIAEPPEHCLTISESMGSLEPGPAWRSALNNLRDAFITLLPCPAQHQLPPAVFDMLLFCPDFGAQAFHNATTENKCFSATLQQSMTCQIVTKQHVQSCHETACCLLPCAVLIRPCYSSQGGLLVCRIALLRRQCRHCMA